MFIIGRGVRVEIGSTEGAALNFTPLTQTKPPVATLNAHGLAAKSLGYVSAAGNIPQLLGQAVRLNPVTANTVSLEDLDGTGYAALVGNLSIVPITAWLTLGTTTDHNKSGGSADALKVTVLLDDIEQEENGLLQAESVGLTLRAETISGAAMAKVRDVARQNGYLVFRLTLKDNNVRFYRGQPSLPSENIGQGAVGSQDITVKIKGFYCEGAA